MGITYRISIIGNGGVGGAVGKVFTKYGYQVIFYDVDQEKRKELASQDYEVAGELAEAVLDTDISFICVPTPTENGRLDRSYVETVLACIREAASSKDRYHTIAIKSTVLPGIVWESNGANSGVCMNPEFLRSETAEEDFENQPIVIGRIDQKATEVLKEFYEDFKRRTTKDFEILVTDATTAAMIKYASNCLLATKISLFNEIAGMCGKLGVDPGVVVRNVIADRHSTIEFYRRDFLSLGFQDECLPKDLDAFISFCSDFDYQPELLRAVKKVNEGVGKQ
ncbi:NAD(P)-binding domain-containing protein [Dehalococcoidia bacterium]|nr:NAD(P)-binding domain-containing protein [Dehalococcoidia bacterium]